MISDMAGIAGAGMAIMRAHVYTHIKVYRFICIYIYIYIHKNRKVIWRIWRSQTKSEMSGIAGARMTIMRAYTFAYVKVYTYMYTHIYIHTYIIHICINIHTHTYTYIYTYIYIYICIYIYVCTRSSGG